MWMHTVLHKDEIQVKESKVVVRDGGVGHWRPVARLHAPKDLLAGANSVGKCLEDHKKTRCQEFRESVRGVRGGIQVS